MEHRKPDILIVDSLAENREAFVRLLADLDITLHLAANISDALNYLAANNISAVLISSDLSDNEGFQLVNKVLGSDETRHIPIILLLPHLSDEKRKLHEPLFAGIDFLYKPVSEQILREKIIQLMQLHENREMLKHRHDETEKLFKAAGEGVLAVNSNGVVVLANAAAGRMLGTTVTHLLGLYLETILEEAHHPLISAWHAHPIYQACREGSVLHVKKSRFWRTDGLAFSASFAAVPVSKMGDMDIVFAFKELDHRNDHTKLAELSKRDHLTTLPNRIRTEEVIEEVILKAKQDHHEMALLLVNLDHFRYINEGLGHELGDKLLMEVARRLQVLVRGEDFVGRLGSDEFPIVLDKLENAENAGVVAKKIIAEIAQPFLLEGHEVSLGASIGIAIFPSCGNSAKELLKNAALALKRAKVIGRNVYQFFSVEMNTHAVQWLRMEQDFRRAMVAGQIAIDYEPIIDVVSGVRIALVPKLIWQHPQQGLIPEKAVVSTAEEIDMLSILGDWVKQSSLHYLSDYQPLQAGEQPLVLFLELYNTQLAQDDFIPAFLAHLRQEGLVCERIVIVLAEKTFASRSFNCEAKVKLLRDAGFKIAIKEFGAGYGSLSLFNRIAFEFIEIAEIFTRDEQGSDSNQSVLKSIIDLSHRLGVKVVMKADENTDSSYLRTLQCDYIQQSRRQ